MVDQMPYIGAASPGTSQLVDYLGRVYPEDIAYILKSAVHLVRHQFISSTGEVVVTFYLALTHGQYDQLRCAQRDERGDLLEG